MTKVQRFNWQPSKQKLSFSHDFQNCPVALNLFASCYALLDKFNYCSNHLYSCPVLAFYRWIWGDLEAPPNSPYVHSTIRVATTEKLELIFYVNQLPYNFKGSVPLIPFAPSQKVQHPPMAVYFLLAIYVCDTKPLNHWLL